MKVDMLPTDGQRSWWFQDVLGTDTHVPRELAGDYCVDVAIVGGGYTGLWTALALHEKSAHTDCAILDAGLCGSQASGKNGGVVHGYWTSLHRLLPLLGVSGTKAVVEAGSKAQSALEEFCCSRDANVWWCDRGLMKVSTTSQQDASLTALTHAAKAIGYPEKVVGLSDDQVQARCASPRFREGVFIPEAATVHPAKLALALRDEAIRHGTAIFENTPVSAIHTDGGAYVLSTPSATLRARSVVLAANSALVRINPARSHLTNFSSFAVMTEPVPELLASIGWTGGEAITDSRMFLHYFRTTADGRVLMGTGSGPIGYGARMAGLNDDAESIDRAVEGIRSLLPPLSDANIAGAWGGPIDVSSDHLPFFGTIGDTRIHYGCGYSGHGVNAAWIGGQILASLALEEENEWTASPFLRRKLAKLPPEPFRYLGGRPIRSAILSCEEAEDRGRVGSMMQRTIASLPKLLGLQIGTR